MCRPLRGRKDTLYEGGVRVVGLVAAPGLGLARGTLYPGLVHVTDWFSTFLSLAGGGARVYLLSNATCHVCRAARAGGC